jgi:hypothetical protein
MTPEQFVYWLQGYTAALEAPEDWRMATIRERLAEVELGRLVSLDPSDIDPLSPARHAVAMFDYPGIVKAMDPITTVDRCDTSKFFMRGADAEDDDFEGAPV